MPVGSSGAGTRENRVVEILDPNPEGASEEFETMAAYIAPDYDWLWLMRFCFRGRMS